MNWIKQQPEELQQELRQFARKLVKGLQQQGWEVSTRLGEEGERLWIYMDLAEPQVHYGFAVMLPSIAEMAADERADALRYGKSKGWSLRRVMRDAQRESMGAGP